MIANGDDVNTAGADDDRPLSIVEMKDISARFRAELDGARHEPADDDDEVQRPFRMPPFPSGQEKPGGDATKHGRVVLAGILPARRDVLSEVKKHLEPEHFVDGPLRDLWKIIVRFHDLSGGVLTSRFIDDLAKTDMVRATLLGELFKASVEEQVTDAEVKVSVRALQGICKERLVGEAAQRTLEVLVRGGEVDGWEVPPGADSALTVWRARLADIDRIALLGGESGDEDRERPQSFDVTELAARRKDVPRPMVVEHLIPRGGVVSYAGEEGDGKTILADQTCRQMHRGEKVLGTFAPGVAVPKVTLFVDAEMEQDEADDRADEMVARGLSVPVGSMFWICAGGLNLSASTEDRAWLEDEIARRGADFVWLDSGTNVVGGDPLDGEAVKAFFNYLSDLMRRAELVAEGLTLHPRKRAQGEHGRRFDDLFGSREWKGRLTKVLYIDGGKVVAWKDRGRHGLREAWPNREAGRYAKAILHRPGLTDETSVPFVVEAGEAEAEVDAEAMAERAVALVSAEPGEYTKTALGEALGGRTGDVLGVVGRLIRSGVLGPDKARSKLTVQKAQSDE